MNMLLEVADLHAGYGRAEVLHGIRVQVMEGQIVTIIGPNGAGKSTTMQAIMRLLPSRGTLRFLGADISTLQTEELVARGLALVPETRALFADMSVEENLLLGAYRLRRHQPTTSLNRVFAIFPRLAERRRQLAGTLSGGERQMLALGRALMGQPKLLLLDEPSLGLAPLIVRDIFRVLDGLRHDGQAILLVEQNAVAALALADYGTVLEMGEVTAEGPSQVLARDPRLMDTYLGRKAGS
jgi:branched-chain amino acid transport system ATP-binding protein